jgi:DNA-directed RNA polymerase subunit RPC12/RpoP
MLDTYQCRLCGKTFVSITAKASEEDVKCPSCGSNIVGLHHPAPANSTCGTSIPGRFRVG